MKNGKYYLAQLETVVNLMLERTHLHLSDELLFDMSVTKDCRKQFIEMRKNDVYLVVDCGVEGRQGKAVVAQIAVTEHVDQQWNNQWSQDIAVGIARVCEGVAEGRDYNTTDSWVFVGEVFLYSHQWLDM